MKIVFTLLSASLLAASFNAGAETLEGRARIVSCENPGITLGSASLKERPSEEGVKQVDVFIKLRNGALPAGKHAVHIHETGVCEPCTAANGHFDPGPNSNSSPDGNHPYHAGDLINIEASDAGSGTLFTSSSRISLSAGPLSVFDADGSAIIIHTLPDTYCPEGEVAGCAGGTRSACGIIQPN